MIWEEGNVGSIYNVALNMRQKDYEEIVALSFCESRKELADQLSRSWAGHKTTIVCGTKEHGAIAAFTYIPMRKGVWSLGLFATNNFQKIHLSLTKLIINSIIPILDKAKAHRVEAQSIDGYEAVHNWLKFLGLNEESVLKSYGRNGEDFINFAWVRGKNDHNVNWIRRGEVA